MSNIRKNHKMYALVKAYASSGVNKIMKKKEKSRIYDWNRRCWSFERRMEPQKAAFTKLKYFSDVAHHEFSTIESLPGIFLGVSWKVPGAYLNPD